LLFLHFLNCYGLSHLHRNSPDPLYKADALHVVAERVQRPLLDQVVVEELAHQVARPLVHSDLNYRHDRSHEFARFTSVSGREIIAIYFDGALPSNSKSADSPDAFCKVGFDFNVSFDELQDALEDDQRAC